MTRSTMNVFLWLLKLASAIYASPTYHVSNDIRQVKEQSCRKLPHDEDWPTQETWAALNATVDGRLIATVPLASSCHDPNYDAAKCDPLRENWEFAQTHFDSPTSIAAPYFQNQSCDPFTAQSSPCRIGDYPVYAINVTKASDVIAGLNFAKSNNVRLVIKNTGHDFLGRSTGAGSLSLWTYNLKNISINDYSASYYTGKAMRMGAGVQSYEAYSFAYQQKLRIVGGTCPTVGLAGGYTQGGGHSLLSSVHGLGADQVLEWEVVTSNFETIIATPEKNKDLYWALSGGGASTYGVVLSMTVKAHIDTRITGAMLTLTQRGAEQAFWDGVTAFHAELPLYTKEDAAVGYIISQGQMTIQPIAFPGRSKADVETTMAPLKQKLNALGTLYQIDIREFSDYYSFFSHYYGPLPYGIYTSAQVQSGRLIPREVVTNNASNQAFTDVLKQISLDSNFLIIGMALDVSKFADSPNAVHPGWRKAILSMIIGAPWDYSRSFTANAQNQMTLTNRWDPLLTNLTGPSSGAYMNEGNFEQTDFQTQFFGTNYARLRQLKKEYDPTDVFYARKTVGSEDWNVEANGRLCRK